MDSASCYKWEKRAGFVAQLTFIFFLGGPTRKKLTQTYSSRPSWGPVNQPQFPVIEPRKRASSLDLMVFFCWKSSWCSFSGFHQLRSSKIFGPITGRWRSAGEEPDPVKTESSLVLLQCLRRNWCSRCEHQRHGWVDYGIHLQYQQKTNSQTLSITHV